MPAPVNDFKPFALDPAAHVMTQAAYAAASTFRDLGYPSGVVAKETLNKVLRQSSAISAALAQIAANATGVDILDDGNFAGLVTKLSAAFGGANTVTTNVTTVAALRLLPSGLAFTAAETTCYATPGDNGGGQYWKDVSDTTSADNGGTVIVSTGGVRWKLMLRDVMRAECFGVVSNGTDTSTALQLAISTGKWIALTAGRTYTAKNITSVDGGGLMCFSGRANFVVVGGTNNFGVLVNTSNFTVSGINFDGGNYGPYNSGSGTFGTRNGLIIGNNYGTGVGFEGITVKDCNFTGFDVCGVQGREVQIGFVFGKKVYLENLYCHHNLIGIWASPRFEYIVANGCFTYANFVGVIAQGGNNTWIGTKSQLNKQNIQLAVGDNDAHGQFIGGDCNHCYTGGWGLYASDVTNGQIFTGMGFWYAPISLVNCIGVFIRQCQIVGLPNVTVDGGGMNAIDDNYTPSPLVKTIVTPVHFTSFRNNRVAAADTSFVPVYGDVAMRSTNTTGGALSLPLVFSSLSDFELPLSYSLKKWQGEDASFLQTSGRIYIPRTGRFRLHGSMRFTVGVSNEKPRLTLVRYSSGGAPQDFDDDCREFSAGATNAVLRVDTEFYCVAGDTIAFLAQTKTGSGGGDGITITALKVLLQSVDGG